VWAGKGGRSVRCRKPLNVWILKSVLVKVASECPAPRRNGEGRQCFFIFPITSSSQHNVHGGDRHGRRCGRDRRGRPNLDFLRYPDFTLALTFPLAFGPTFRRGRFDLVTPIVFAIFLTSLSSFTYTSPSSSSSWPPPPVSAFDVELTADREGTSNLTPLILNPFSLFDNLTLHTFTPSLTSSSNIRSHGLVAMSTVLKVRRGTKTGVFVTAGAFTFTAFRFTFAFGLTFYVVAL
jgi:hypothetical protein